MSIWHENVQHAFLGIASKEIKPEGLLKEWRNLVDEIVTCRKRLKNPIHKRTGKPLAKSTILGFKNKIDSIKSELRHYRPVFKLLRLFGYFGCI